MVHRIKSQFEHDCRRSNDLLDAGWRVYRLTGSMIRAGESIALLERILK